MMIKIKGSQERMRSCHRKINAPPGYSVGDKILFRDKERDYRKGNKLETTWFSAVYTMDVVKSNAYYISNDGIRLKKMRFEKIQ